MKIIADLHMHTLVSQHAYSTLDEMSLMAKEKGFLAFAITDHGPQMPDGAIPHHFYCLQGLPKVINGLRFYTGTEVNIVDYHGGLDLENTLLDRLDFVIASYHMEAILPSTKADHTEGWLNVIQNASVDCIGHCGNPQFPCDLDAVVQACGASGKLIEINSASFTIRKGSYAPCKYVASLCKKLNVPIVVNSDAHSKYFVGQHSEALTMLKEMDFPEELIVNASIEALTSRLGK